MTTQNEKYLVLQDKCLEVSIDIVTSLLDSKSNAIKNPPQTPLLLLPCARTRMPSWVPGK